MPNQVTFEWTDLTDETFNQIDRPDPNCRGSELVLAIARGGAMYVGRIYQNKALVRHRDRYTMDGIVDPIKFVKVENIQP